MKSKLTLIAVVCLLVLQQYAGAQPAQPLPVPRLTLNSVQDYRNLGTQFIYTFSVANWMEFQKQVDQRYGEFDAATMQLPPSPCKGQGNARFQSRMAALIYSGEDKPLGCYALFSPRGQLAEIKLNLPRANVPDSFYLVIRDLLNKESVKSNTVYTGSHNKTVPVTKSTADAQSQSGTNQRRTQNSGPQQPSTGDLPKVLIARGQGLSRETPRRVAIPAYRPQVLTPAQMQNVLKTAAASLPKKPTWLQENVAVPTNDFVTLTPQQPYVEGAGRLDFHTASIATEAQSNTGLDIKGSAFFPRDVPDQSSSALDIYLKPAKVGQMFLLNISLVSLVDNPLTVTLPDGGQEQITLPFPKTLGASIQPMVVVFTAENTNWQHIGIQNLGPPSFTGWIFFRCEVRSIQPN